MTPRINAGFIYLFGTDTLKLLKWDKVKNGVFSTFLLVSGHSCIFPWKYRLKSTSGPIFSQFGALLLLICLLGPGEY